MAEKSGFFNSSNGDRKYKAEFFAEYFASFIGNGVFPNPSTNLQVISNNDMTVTVKAGLAWINGYIYINDNNLILSVDVADGVLKRRDRVVLQYSTIDRSIKAKIKKGTFASSPVAPVLQRDADIYELGIADIYIANGAISISQANITDLRLDTTKCGIVHGTVDQVDTTTLFNQYLSWYTQTTGQAETNIANLQTQLQTSFNTWFSGIQAALNGDTAGNLLNMINANTEAISLKAPQASLDITNQNVNTLNETVVSHTTQLAQKANQTSLNTTNQNLANTVKVKSNITILSALWVNNTATTGFYTYDIADADITASTVVDVNIRLADLEKASDIKSASESFAGYVRLYANSAPTENIICDLRLTRQVV